MANTKPKNFRMDRDFLSLLALVAKQSGVSETQIMQLSGSLYAVRIGVEVKRAREFLFNNLLAAVATEQVHRPHHNPIPRPSKRRKIAHAPPR
jgi:hypothetical protein